MCVAELQTVRVNIEHMLPARLPYVIMPSDCIFSACIIVLMCVCVCEHMYDCACVRVCRRVCCAVVRGMLLGLCPGPAPVASLIPLA